MGISEGGMIPDSSSHLTSNMLFIKANTPG